MASNYINKLHLDLDVSMVTFNVDADKVMSVDIRDVMDTYDASNLSSPFAQVVELAKNAADVEVVPPSISGVKFAFIRVKTEGLATSPDDGQIVVKITSQVGTNQVLKGDFFMIKDKGGEITSIKLTNNENDSTGVSLPVLVILGGKP